MNVRYLENLEAALSTTQLEELTELSFDQLGKVERALLIHPDYSRNDFSDSIVPIIYSALSTAGLKRLDTLNAGGTHRPMTEQEILHKLGLDRQVHTHLGTLFNHAFDDPSQLIHITNIPEEFVCEKTGGQLREPMSVTANKLITAGYDLIIALSGTVPHEALGFSGGLKIFFPGISGPEVIALLHWAAVLIGIPKIIGSFDNPARDVVLEGSRHYFSFTGDTPVVSFNMLFGEAHDKVVPKGLYIGYGLDGFIEAHRMAASASAKIHLVYIDEPLHQVVQNIPAMYDEIWTAGKGSYKLQKEGVLAPGAEVILYAPHITCFHSNPRMDLELRDIGYHGRDWVVDYIRHHPDFNKNVAAHVINVRGPATVRDGKEQFAFNVTLATGIPEKDCTAVGLGYRDPRTIRPEDFRGRGKLWIEDGGKWLYDLKD